MSGEDSLCADDGIATTAHPFAFFRANPDPLKFWGQT